MAMRLARGWILCLREMIDERTVGDIMDLLRIMENMRNRGVRQDD